MSYPLKYVLFYEICKEIKWVREKQIVLDLKLKCQKTKNELGVKVYTAKWLVVVI